MFNRPPKDTPHFDAPNRYIGDRFNEADLYPAYDPEPQQSDLTAALIGAALAVLLVLVSVIVGA